MIPETSGSSVAPWPRNDGSAAASQSASAATEWRGGLAGRLAARGSLIAADATVRASAT